MKGNKFIMGCNCKKHINPKYLEEDEVETKQSGLSKIFTRVYQIFFQVIFGIVSTALVLIIVIPFLLYVIFCLFTGRNAHARIPKLDKLLKG